MATSRHLELISGVLTEVVTDLTGGAPSALYKVRTAGTGYSVDHTLMAVALVTQASPFTVTLKWVNLDTGLEVTPVLTHLQLISADVGQKTSANSLSIVVASDQVVPVGGVFEPTPTLLTAGQRAEAQVDRLGRLRVTANRGVPTYSASFFGAVDTTATTDFFTIYGAAGKVVTITRIRMSATQTTAGNHTVAVVKRQAVDTGGTATSVSAVSHDPGDAAASATVLAYTASPTALGAGTPVKANRMYIGTNTSLFAAPMDIQFGEGSGHGLVLRNANQGVALNLGGANFAGNSVAIDVEWTEE